MTNHLPGNTEPYDLVGIGFGPAGIALAVAIADAEENSANTRRLKRLFIEQAKDSTWQAGMLLPGSNIQHHFLRDFATPRNPRSQYTFVNYLKVKGRLFSFGVLNHDGDPGRIEWSDYVQWVASQVDQQTLYNHRVVEIQPYNSDATGPIKLIRVRTTSELDQTTNEFYTHNVVLSTGRKPNIPAVFANLLGPTVFHAHTFKTSIRTIHSDDKPTFAVLGSGQNAIEILLYLSEYFPNSPIYSIGRNNGFRLYDLGHFSNEIYFPDEVEYFHQLPKDARQALFEEAKLTTYSAIDDDVSKAMYWRVYEEQVQGVNRIHMLKRSIIADARRSEHQIELRIEDIYNHATSTVIADFVILCTGHLEQQVPSLLTPCLPLLRQDSDGDLLVSLNYEVLTRDSLDAGIFLNGLTERTHGISDAASFSMMALKAGRILDSILLRNKHA